jgi:hypothetical protein
MGDRRGTCRVLVRGEQEGRTLEKCSRRWEVNSKIDLQETGCDEVAM